MEFDKSKIVTIKKITVGDHVDGVTEIDDDYGICFECFAKPDELGYGSFFYIITYFDKITRISCDEDDTELCESCFNKLKPKFCFNCNEVHEETVLKGEKYNICEGCLTVEKINLL